MLPLGLRFLAPTVLAVLLAVALAAGSAGVADAHGDLERSSPRANAVVTGAPDEFYDLVLDPFETSDLLPGLSPDEQQAFDVLAARLIALGVE